MIIYQDMGGQAFEVLFLTTVPEQRKRGEMSELLRGLKNISESREIWLECREDNHGAISLYQKLGFAESGRRSSYYKDGMTAILFNF